MGKKIWMSLGLIATVCSLTSCGNETDRSNHVTELLEVEEGMVFQTLENAATEISTQQNESEVVLIAENIEGKKETRIILKKYTQIYAKPSKDASMIGECGRGDELGVYGKSEVNGWYMVSYNGRVGYVKETSIDEEERDTIDTTRNENNHQNSENNSNVSNPTTNNRSESQTSNNQNQTQNSSSTANQTQNSGNRENEISDSTIIQEPDSNENIENIEEDIQESDDISESNGIQQPNEEAASSDNSENITDNEETSQIQNMENDTNGV